MPNIEIKARYLDLDKARNIAKLHQTEYVGVLHQIDTYFKTKTGRLKLREFGDGPAQLIPYRKDYQAGPMRSDYAVLTVDDPALVKTLLTNLLGVEFVVDKYREVFLIDNVRVHLDRVAELGNFLEFEAVCSSNDAGEHAREAAKVEKLMRTFEISPVDLMERSYVDYLTHSVQDLATVESLDKSRAAGFEALF